MSRIWTRVRAAVARLWSRFGRTRSALPSSTDDALGLNSSVDFVEPVGTSPIFSAPESSDSQLIYDPHPELSVPPEALGKQSGLLLNQVLALLSTSKQDPPTKLAVLSLVRAHLLLANYNCSWQDMPADAWIEYCLDENTWMSVLLDGAMESRAKRKAKETIDRVAKSVVEETKKEKK